MPAKQKEIFSGRSAYWLPQFVFDSDTYFSQEIARSPYYHLHVFLYNNYVEVARGVINSGILVNRTFQAWRVLFLSLFRIFMYSNFYVADSETVLLHMDHGYLSMQSGALHAERIGNLLGRHPHCDVDWEVRLFMLNYSCKRLIVRHRYYDRM